MIHDEKMIENLKTFIDDRDISKMAPEDIYNEWINDFGHTIHDFDTTGYILNVISLAKEAKENEI